MLQFNQKGSESMKAKRVEYPVVSVIIDDEGETKIKLLKGFRFYFNRKTHYIKKDFICDGASIPRAFWRIVGHPLEGKYLPGALVHDFCYRTHCVSRSDADYLFYTLLRKYEVSFVKRCAMWLAVRLFGGACYGKINKAA